MLDKAAILFIAIGLLLFSCSNGDSSVKSTCTDDYLAGWQTIIDKEAQFQIEFPNCSIIQRTETMVYDNKEFDQKHYIVNLQEYESNSLGYSASYHYLELASEQIEDFLHMQGMANEEGTNGVIEVEKKLNKWPHSREFTYKMPHDLILRQRMLYHKNMIYKWSVVTSKENRFNKSVSKFLDSFRMLE